MNKHILVGFFILIFTFTCGFLNIAHRGDNEQGKFAEHSWVAYDRAVCAKVDYLELDLQQTADNVLVVSHDENLSRVFGIDKSIANLYYHDLITYKNQNGESIHRLADVFQRYQSSNVKFMIEPKDSSDNEINNLLSLIKKYHLQNRVLLESFSERALLKIHKSEPQIPLTQLAGDFKISPMLQYYANNFYAKTAADYLGEHNKKYLLWGIDTETQMKKYSRPEENVSGILTDYPVKLAAILHENNVFKRYYEAAAYPSESISGYMYLKNGKKVYVDQVKMKDNQLFYHVKPNIWISYDNLKNSNKFAPKAQVGKIKLDHDAQVYTDPAFEKKTEKKLRKDSAWNYFAVKKMPGKTAYNLGGAQWVSQ